MPSSMPAGDAPMPEPEPVNQTPEATMPSWTSVLDSPLTKLALGMVNPILAAAPEIAHVFLDKQTGQTVPERNVKAALKVLDVAGKSLSVAGIAAPNAQAIAEAVAVDPRAKQAVRDGLLASYHDIVVVEGGGGGVSGAREWAVKAGQVAPAVLEILRRVTYAALAFLLLANLITGIGYVLALIFKPDQATAMMQMLGSVIEADKAGAFIALGFWLGSSVGSRSKDQTKE